MNVRYTKIFDIFHAHGSYKKCNTFLTCVLYSIMNHTHLNEIYVTYTLIVEILSDITYEM